MKLYCKQNKFKKNYCNTAVILKKYEKSSITRRKVSCQLQHLLCTLIIDCLLLFLGVTPDNKQTPRRNKYVSGSSGNGGQGESAGEAALQSETSDVTEEKLSKMMEEKLQNNGTGSENSKCNKYVKVIC